MCQSCLRSEKLVLRNKSYQMSLMNLPDVDDMNQINNTIKSCIYE